MFGKKINRGVAVLDTQLGEGWVHRIKPDLLVIHSTSRCVLGQLDGFGDYRITARRVGIGERIDGYGFALPTPFNSTIDAMMTKPRLMFFGALLMLVQVFTSLLWLPVMYLGYYRLTVEWRRTILRLQEERKRKQTAEDRLRRSYMLVG